MTKVQEFLREAGTLEDLARIYAVKHSRHGAFPNLVQLKYSQVDSPMHEPIVQECRGILLDESEHWRIVARGYNKFFNHGEPNAAEIDWDSASVQEKLDGSLIMVYWYRGTLQVATTGRPDASGEVNGHNISFRDLFLQAMPPDFRAHETEFTYLFELTTPYNRVVVRHRDSSATLLVMRSIETGEYKSREYLQSVSQDLGVGLVREFSLASLDDVLSTFRTLEPVEQEGYVVVDRFHNRVKIKHPGYVALHQMKDSLSPKSFLETIRRGETAEVLAHFPELEPIFLPIQTEFESLVSEVDADYRELCQIELQKDFAAQALLRKCSAALFSVRAGKAATIRDFFAGAHIGQVMRLVGLKETEPVSEKA